VSGREAIKAFGRNGWRVVSVHGSQVIMEKAGHDEILTVPLHPELHRGTLRSLIRAAGLTVERFRELL
jgi:predicted RNA binding protein YcfA (HicA-like mRNA interferase family)